MKYTPNLADVLKTALEANKKISRIDELKDMVGDFCYNTDVINSLPRNATQLENGLLLTDIPYPVALGSMVYPNSVTVNGKEQDTDFLERTVPCENPVVGKNGEKQYKLWTRADWLDFCTKLYNSRRAEADWVAVSELRKNELLANVAEIAAYDVTGDAADDATECCGYACEERFPIPLAIMVKKKAFYCQNTDDMAKDYIFRNMLLSISKK